MARVYVSSTFEDLKEFRGAARQALLELRHEVRAMETYVASHERPAEFCAADVDWSEFYVGIFAWRYGYVPEADNPERRSITEMEYRQALEGGKECLIFLLDEEAPWLPKFLDSTTGANEAGDRIRRLRQELSTRHTPTFFRTADDLARKVTASLTNALDQRTKAGMEDERRERASESERQRRREGRRVAGIRIPDAGALFRDRTDQRRELSRLIAEPGTRIVSVLGRAGIGKTALAARVLRDIERGSWPHADQATAVDGIVYLSSRSDSLTLESLFNHCALMVGGERETRLRVVWRDAGLTTEEKVERLLQALENGLYVILMDHVDAVLDEKTRRIADPDLRIFYERATAVSRGARLVVTARDPVALNPRAMRFDRQVVLEQGLPMAEGIAFLRDMDPNGTLGLRDLPDEKLGRAVERLHGLPKALELLAALVQRDALRSLDEILQGFYTSEDVVDELVRETFRRLGRDEHLVVQALTVFGRPAKMNAVEFIVGSFVPGLAVEAVLTSLIHSRMLRFDRGESLFSLDEIDREYALSQLTRTGDDRRPALERRVAEYWASLRVDREQWRSRVDFDPQITQCEHLIKAGDIGAAAEVLASLDLEYIARTGSIDRVQALQRRLKGRIREPRLQALYLLGVGQIRCFVGPLPKAPEALEAARREARTCGDAEIERLAVGWIGEALRRLGFLDEAVENLIQACRIYRSEDIPMRDTFPLELSLAHSYKGQPEKAIWWAKRMETLTSRFAQEGLYGGQADDALALACVIAGEFAVAVEHARRAVEHYRSIEANDPIAYVINVWGMALMGLGRGDEAIERFGEAREEALQNVIPRAEGLACFNQARALRSSGAGTEALEKAREASEVLERIGSPEAVAARSLEQVLLAQESGDHHSLARALLECARSSLRSADLLFPLDLIAEAEAVGKEEDLEEVVQQARALSDKLRTG